MKSNSLEQAIEWLSEHANDPVVEETKQESAQSMETATEESTGTFKKILFLSKLKNELTIFRKKRRRK